MTILLSSAVHEDWCAFTGTRLQGMGVLQPVSGARSELSPLDLTHKMHLASGARKGQLTRVDPAALGQTWSIAAADVVLANSEQEIWGWSDPLNLPFLDFWRDFDPRCRFVLVYGSPAKYVAAEISRSADAIDRVESILKRWTSYHSSMLSFYQRNPDACILADIQGFDGTATAVAEALSQKLDLSLSTLAHPAYREETPTLQLISERILSNRQEQDELFSELQNSADIIMGAQSTSNRGISEKAIEEQFSLRAETRSLASTIDLQQAKITQLEQQILKHEARIEELTEASHARDAANVVLYKKQLAQVRDELHYYYCKYSEATSAATDVSTTPASHASQAGAAGDPADRAFVDLRSFVDGTGWHQPEDRGRWAGADRVSTVKIPKLRLAKYRLSARILDSMSLEVLRSMRFRINDVDLNTRLKILSDMGGRLAPLRRIKAQYNNVENPFPASLIATIHGQDLNSTGQNELAIVSSIVQRPSANFGDDDRTLSCFFENIEIVRVD